MSDYQKDFYSWTCEQAELLRAGRFNELDVFNLVEEIETMGRSEKRELQSRLMVLLVHLLKWQYQPARRGRSWTLTIKGQRINVEDVINDNPGLKPQLLDLLSNAYRLAIVEVSKQTMLEESIFPVKCPWTLDQIRDEGFFPD
ncbi:MAG: DUF29 domain-containing protein [Gammaproteobacteria bacterium]